MKEILNKLNLMKTAKVQMRGMSTATKNKVLIRLADKLTAHTEALLSANSKDVSEFKKQANYQTAFVDRLTLTGARIQQMAESLRVVAELQDPVGQVVEQRTLPNGLHLERRRSPLGLIFLIFEARPNVITEAFSLALKSGNALLLKGGKESDHSSAFIYSLITEALKEENLSEDLFWGLVGADRVTTDFLMKQNKFIDVLIPRGGERLIEHVTNHSNIPIIKNDRGLCHVYVHEKADLQMALEIVDNAKTHRPSVCNAAETLLVDRAIAPVFLPMVFARLRAKGVTWVGCPETLRLLPSDPGLKAAGPEAFDLEYLDLTMNLGVVGGFAEALQHIERHSSGHSEAIITNEPEVAREFERQVDSAAVYWNASTRFTDGSQLGLGAEIGISTQKLHVRGPVGLEALTSARWIIEGKGQIRV